MRSPGVQAGRNVGDSRRSRERCLGSDECIEFTTALFARRLCVESGSTIGAEAPAQSVLHRVRRLVRGFGHTYLSGAAPVRDGGFVQRHEPVVRVSIDGGTASATRALSFQLQQIFELEFDEIAADPN